ncbi:uncharacterized protein K452DRAFT_234879 [Aplosporella prunicola CBS 121167]|uniref:JmjC domain-containing protein n=1 Tax=Aplosporella prunicola CBS 121167 TaxID=1176127 RepID=A0A6A6B486_9PEZI|nr:uncharacterized protein K452DRAFT_234879 [Aplosporella prunicola CBS 121167]KAF2138034.1 hypothetical protein K452DRAFT_234879 [Aplosporella prunicola CBS 121167]
MTPRTTDPVRLELARQFRARLSVKRDYDSLHEQCPSHLQHFETSPEAATNAAHRHIHSIFPFTEVPHHWFRLYTEGSCWQAVEILEARGRKRSQDWLFDIVNVLDRAKIIAGAVGRLEDIEWLFARLTEADSPREPSSPQQAPNPTIVRTPEQKSSSTEVRGHRRVPTLDFDVPDRFPDHTLHAPNLRFPIPRRHNLSMTTFQEHLDIAKAKKADDVDLPTPLVLTGALEHWPALSERPWSDPHYLLSKTLGGRRLVPIETGKHYMAAGWGQGLISFGEFMEEYVLIELPDSDGEAAADESISSESSSGGKTGYLAQHDLFAQIPSLRADIAIPDYCHTDAPPAPPPPFVNRVDKVEEPQLNAWFGPANTVSPVHTDPYHNIFAQVVGSKYVRLYAPSERENLYPRRNGQDIVPMENNSNIDIGEIGKAKPMDQREFDKLEKRRRVFEEKYPRFKNAKYVETVLGPGECLYIPIGWWHYVRSLSPSFSVSFWWN